MTAYEAKTFSQAGVSASRTVTVHFTITTFLRGCLYSSHKLAVALENDQYWSSKLYAFYFICLRKREIKGRKYIQNEKEKLHVEGIGREVLNLSQHL